jgi:glycosyltransferase involved in cell wall biosynthesis
MPRRLVHVITRVLVGGATLTTVEAALGLRDHFDVHVACGTVENPHHSLIRTAAEQIPFHVVPELRRPIHPLHDLHGLRALRRLMERLGADIVHTHSSKAGILGREAATRVGIPAVHSVHGWGHTPLDSFPRRQLLILSERWAATRCRFIAAVSTDVRDEGLRLKIGHPEQYRIVPEWVKFKPSFKDHATGRQIARAKLAIEPKTEVIGWVGRFTPQKDPSTLARALVKVLDSRRGAVAVLAGEGPDMDVVRQIAREGGCADRMKFLGTRDDVRGILPAFDVVVHTSLWEGHPRVIQEAIAERVPVVATRVSGVRDILKEERLGAIVPPGDPDAVASACGHYLTNRERYVPIAPDVLAAAERNMGDRASLDAHLKLYSDLGRRF